MLRWPSRSGVVFVGLIVAATTVACASKRFGPLPSCAPDATTADSRLEIFSRPFEGEHPRANVFDHDLPMLSEDHNGYLLTMCGSRIGGLDGHNGYDWMMPVGTPLLAVADGRVLRAWQEPPLFCPSLHRQANGARVVVIEIRPNATDVVRAMYGHLDRIDVKEGDAVRAGEIVGTSGNTGCSTAPHLHFNAARVLDGREILVDPYGWHSPAPDPWAADSRGAKSLWLWKPSAAPRLF